MNNSAAHTELKHQIRKRLGREADLALFNNTSGVKEEWDDTTSDVRRMRFGLFPGASDLLGMLAPHARWIALEVKTGKGCETDDQARFIELVRRFGGFACVVRSVEDAVAAIERARRGESA